MGKPAIILAAFAVLFALLFFGCFNSSPSPDGGAGQKLLTVTVYFKGPVEGAAMSVYSTNADGSPNKRLAGPLMTDEDGWVYFEFDQPTGRLMVESIGGSYFEDVGEPAEQAYAGKPVVKSVDLPAKYAMRAYVPAGNGGAVVTPFTGMAARLAQKSMQRGVATDAAARAANVAVGQQYGVENIISTVPAAAYDPSAVWLAVRQERAYGLLLAGLTQEAGGMDVEPAMLADALADDWSDGTLDGRQEGEPIQMQTASGSPAALPPSAGLAGLQAGVRAFASSPVDASGLGQFSIALTPVSTDTEFYIDTGVLPAWVDGESGSYTMSARGGKSPLRWSLRAGSGLPAGFGLDQSGTISGRGSLGGSVGSISPPFIVVVTDSSSPPRKREIELRIEIVPPPPRLTVNNAVCQVGSSCKVSVVNGVAGGTPPYHFAGYASSAGSYPLDLMIWNDGTLQGTPSRAGSYVIRVCVVDLIGWADCQDAAVRVNEKPKPKAPSGGENSVCSAQAGKVLCGYCSDDAAVNSHGGKCRYCPSGSKCTGSICGEIRCASGGGGGGTSGGGGGGGCAPGHYSTTCDGVKRCCFNGWSCCGDGDGSCCPG